MILHGQITAAASGQPVAGASISVCPPPGTARACATGTSGENGGYVLSGLAKGNWLVQVEPANGNLFGASDHIDLTADTALNFGLRPPVPLADGVSFQTPFGGESSGVPSINWDEPYGINMPVHVPTTEAPNTNLAFVLTAGVGSDGGSSTTDAGFNLAGVLMFSAHYGADGTMQSVSPPIVGQVNCTPSAGQVSPCALMSTLSQSAGSQASARSLHSVGGGGPVVGGGGPIAHAAECPPASGFTITPNKFGGIDVNIPFPDGSVHTLSVYQAAIPATVSTGNYWQDLVLNLGVGAVNTVVGALIPEVGLYNAVVGTLNTIASLPGNSLSAKILASGGAIESILGAALNKETHGASYYFGNMVSGLLGQGLNTSASSGATAAPQPDCPPKNGVSGGGGGSYTNVGGSFVVDPSGTIQTTHGAPLYRARVSITRSSSASGRQTPVPNGSSILAASNRHNPSMSSLLGSFGWDVTPGYYQIDATHPGCAAPAHGKTARSPVYAVPPPRVNLILRLSCPHLHRAPTRVHLVVLSGHAGSEQIIATVSAAHGAAGASALLGAVTFKAGRRTLTSVLVNRRRMAIVDLPHVPGVGRRTTARYGGNGLYAPSAATSG
ncbi:MAG TPA: carboxypeptidase-like regulatory domain-containing protein [Solirubrobacteraceae bacterium]|nr:carboxypeptidase-like regulatory domain-containing protein [Solirubrobacteraceae bacterium]